MSTFSQQIEQLRQMDRKLSVAGAKDHRYEFHIISPVELKVFEEWRGCRLPEDYREFITEIGVGAGPSYGLLSFGKIRGMLADIYDDYNERYGLTARPGDPFGLDKEIELLRNNNSESNEAMRAPRSPGGFIPICDLGCEFATVLVTSGKFAGLVFNTSDFIDTNAGWWPAGRPGGIVEYPYFPRSLPGYPEWPTFSDWIAGWLEQCFDDLRRKFPYPGK